MEKLDSYCEKIFMLLVANREKIRFNKLHEMLNGLDAEMSKPTLIAHLHHLQVEGFILRKKEDKQNVTYQVNWKKFEQLAEAIKFKEAVVHNVENEKVFKSRNLEEQIFFVIGILTWEQFLNLELYVADILQPKSKTQHRLAYILIHNLYDIYRRWLLDTCRESEENSQKAFDILKKAIEEHRNILFGK